MYRLAVFTDGGLVYWIHDSEEATSIPPSVLDSFVSRVLIEGSTNDHSQAYEGKDAVRTANVGTLTAKYARDRHSGSNVALLYPSIAPIKKAELIVTRVLKIFLSLSSNTPGVDGASNRVDLGRFTDLVQLELKETDLSVESGTRSEFPSQAEQADISTPEVKLSTTTPTPSTPGKDPKLGSSGASKKKKPAKTLRKWDGSEGVQNTASLDYSEPAGNDGESGRSVVQETDVDLENYGRKSKHGFEINDLQDELDQIMSGGSSEKAEPFQMFRSLLGGKIITDKDLDSVLSKMETHLISKNVAQEAAQFLVGEVRRDLTGAKTKNWTSISATVRSSMSRTLTSILTPKTSMDLLLEVRKRQKHTSGPYAISVVGVNGVGKSTNLGKIAFWLLQNDLKVLVAACDTFRSGAVEQLKVHVDRLSQLSTRQGHGTVELFSQGYGKDAAVIAQKAVEHAKKHHFDVVLMDTAGRRHNDERLMSSLEKFGTLAKPDKIIMVGEALVGSDSVQQARNFDAAFGKSRHIDFFLISKVDTVGDMLGTIVNMTYSTGVPVLFVGVGQTYTDLRTLSVDWAVDRLLS